MTVTNSIDSTNSMCSCRIFHPKTSSRLPDVSSEHLQQRGDLLGHSAGCAHPTHRPQIPVAVMNSFEQTEVCVFFFPGFGLEWFLLSRFLSEFYYPCCLVSFHPSKACLYSWPWYDYGKFAKNMSGPCECGRRSQGAPFAGRCSLQIKRPGAPFALNDLF